MPKASPLQPSFAAGEFSPKLYGRTDTEQYKTGLAKCLNYLPNHEGPLVRRPGTKYVGNDVKDPSNPPVLIPFQVSATDNYILEFGNQYLRFYKNNGQVVASGTLYVGAVNNYDPTYYGTGAAALIPEQGQAIRRDVLNRPGETSFSGSAVVGGTILEMATPFTAADVSKIRYSGSYDTLYLTTGNHMVYKLQRFDEYDWALKSVVPIDGPYLPFNSHTSTGDATNVTLTPDSIIDYKGNTLSNVTTGPRAEIKSFSTGAYGPNSTYITINMSTVAGHAFYVGQKVAIPDEGLLNTTGFVNRTYTVSAVGSSTLSILESPPAVHNGAYVGSGWIYPALFNDNDSFRLVGLSNGGKRYWGFITANSSAAASGGSTYKARFAPCVALPNANACAAWQLGIWRTNEWPKVSTFHQDRLALAGNPARPLEVALSNTSDYENFQTSNSSYVVTDRNALQFTLNAQQLNTAQWIASDANGLLIGGISSEWKISPSSQAAALTPTNVNAVETSYFGSADAAPTKAGNAVLYIQRSNRNIRELNYFFQVNTYRSTNVCELSEHITAPGITALSNQKETVPVVWGMRSDGGLVSMTYNRDESALNAGWAQHQFGGQSDSGGTAPKVLSVATIAGSGATFDQLWMCVQRFINGTSVVNVEYMTKPFEDTDALIEDSFHVDCGGTYDSPLRMSGLTVAGSAVVTSTSHGLADGDQVQITKVVGLNTSVVDINGVVFNSNLVNYNVFRVGSVSANAFFIQDVNNGSSYIDSRGYSTYVSGGEIRKLVTNITGLTWLKGEQVSVLADGKVHPITQVGTGGTLALQFPAAKVQVGLPYNSDGKTLRLDAGSADGSAIGKLRRPARVAFQVNNVGDLSVGTAFDRLTPMADIEAFKADATVADKAPPLFSGLARESVEGEHSFDGQICFRQSTPLPGMIQSITTILEENDV